MATDAGQPLHALAAASIQECNSERSDRLVPSPARRRSTQQSTRSNLSDQSDFVPSSPHHKSTGFSARSKASSLVELQWDRQCVLSLDGGGIRGYSSLLILREIMLLVARKERRVAEAPAESSFHPLPYQPNFNNGRRPTQEVERCKCLPCHYFDYIGGTSTGGLISIILGRLRMGIDECIEEYEKFGGEIFGHPRWASIRGPIPFLRDKYSGERLQNVIEDVVARRLPPHQLLVGAGNFSSAPALCKTIVAAYEQKRIRNHHEYGAVGSESHHVQASNAGPYLFRSYNHWGSKQRDATERNPGAAHSIPIWQVARATTSAPTYFDPVEIQNRKYGDGGFGTNNPVSEVYWEAVQMNGNDASSISLLLSVGTGQSEVSRFADGAFRKFYAYLKAAKKLASDSEGCHENFLRFKPSDLEYCRLNVPNESGLGDMKLDEWKKEGDLKFKKTGIRLRNEADSTLAKIKHITRTYCNQPMVRAKLEDVAEILVNHRRARCRDSSLWELFSTGVQYWYMVRKCRKTMELRPCRDSLRRHLILRHNYHDETEDGRRDLEEMVNEGRCNY
ncbi:FabD/lysophospholipase-like protein [Glonium stellatum]|uniref:FabD/lysophospholipase-like protein n=1 Tax=Glonium stellatum TaxID=574774 RepID=A0A8E2JT05_9PEZI|nr:FabD/lysophospholipase-like protein [Glonium stellatum]